MYRLYLDTCILNDTFPLLQRERGISVRPQDVKMPLSRWAAEYVALYHLPGSTDEWAKNQFLAYEDRRIA